MRPPISLTSHIHRSIRQTIPTPIHHHHPSRPFTSSSIKMSSASTTPQPTFSSNYDPAQGNQDLAPLLKSNGGKWTLIESGKGVERGFKFKTFKKTWVRSSCSYFLSPSFGSLSLSKGVGFVWALAAGFIFTYGGGGRSTSHGELHLVAR